MSNVDVPQGSSGGESGWTRYLDDGDEVESSVSAQQYRRTAPGSYRPGRSWNLKEEDDDDENLSMVSDASSGPPYYEVEDWGCHMNGGGFVAGLERSGKKKNTRQRTGGRHSHYEDTACSHQVGLLFLGLVLFSSTRLSRFEMPPRESYLDYLCLVVGRLYIQSPVRVSYLVICHVQQNNSNLPNNRTPRRHTLDFSQGYSMPNLEVHHNVIFDLFYFFFFFSLVYFAYDLISRAILSGSLSHSLHFLGRTGVREALPPPAITCSGSEGSFKEARPVQEASVIANESN